MISKELDIARSTLSDWFRDRPYTPNPEALKRATLGRTKYGQMKRDARIKETDALLLKGRNEIGNLTQRDLKMVGLGVWLGEGSKTTEQIRLANSDPTIIRLWMRWLREICGVSNEHIIIRMHLYLDSDELVCREYWQTITGLPISAFRKTQFDQRVKKIRLKAGKLPHGTVHIIVIGNGDPEKGVRLYRRMKGWVSAILASE